MDQGETTNLSFSLIFGKTEGRLSALGLVCYRIQRGYTSLRILPQEGARIIKVVSEVKVAQSFLTLCNLMNYIQSMEFSKLEYWSRYPFPSTVDLPNPGIEPRSPALRVDSSSAEPQGGPRMLEYVAYPFSSRSSWPRNQTRVSWIAGRFFTSWAIREAL